MPRRGRRASPPSWATRKNDLDLWNTLVARCIEAAGGQAGRPDPQRLWLRALHRRARPAWRRAERWAAPSCRRRGGQTERQVQLICDLKPRIICCTPSYMLVLAEALERAGVDPREHLARDRHLRRRALERCRCARDRSAASVSPRSISTACRKCSAPASRRNVPMRAARSRSGKTHSYPEIVDPATGALLARRRRRRTRLHLAVEGSRADHPLSHRRSVAAASARRRRPDAAHGPHHSAAATTC